MEGMCFFVSLLFVPFYSFMFFFDLFLIRGVCFHCLLVCFVCLFDFSLECLFVFVSNVCIGCVCVSVCFEC